MVLERIKLNEILRFKKDYRDIDGYIPKGTLARFEGKSLYAHFRLLKPLETWRDGKDTLILIPYKLVFKILEKIDKHIK